MSFIVTSGPKNSYNDTKAKNNPIGLVFFKRFKIFFFILDISLDSSFKPMTLVLFSKSLSSRIF